MPLRPSSLELLESRIAPAALLVTSAADDAGAGTLRNVINGSHAGDVISFAPAVLGKVITLTQGEIAITHSLTINGPGADSVFISGNNASRIFNIDDGNASNSTVTLNGLSLINAKSGGSGGAILSAENLIVSNSFFSGNSSSSSGGAIEEASATAGLLLENTQIINNTAIGSTGGGGVGFQSGGSFGALGCFIANNTTVGVGGGLTLTETGSGDLYVINSTISHNSATQGGGVYFNNPSKGADGLAQTADDGLAMLYGSLVTSNTASTSGGGVDFDAGRAMLLNSTLKSNTAPQGGGGVTTSATDTLLVTGSSFQQNHATDAAKSGGGALYLAVPPVPTATTISGATINTSEFVGNQSAVNGGAISDDLTGLTLNLTSFRQNSAAYRGGAINAYGVGMNDAPLSVTNSEFLANTAGGSGGAVSYSGFSLSFTMVAFTDNTSGSEGGAIFAGTSGPVTLHYIAATGNTAAGYGGAMYLDESASTDLDFVRFQDNSALQDGGALYLDSIGRMAQVTLQHAIISGNIAKNTGGGVIFYSPHLNIASSEIIHNFAGTSGGGIKSSGSGTLTLDPATTLIANNTANDGTQSS